MCAFLTLHLVANVIEAMYGWLMTRPLDRSNVWVVDDTSSR